MLARIKPESARTEGPAARFRPARWYSAEWSERAAGLVRLHDGAASAVWREDELVVRTVADDEWEITAFPRARTLQAEQVLEYPARLAECPQGHQRTIPLKFDGEAVELHCRECRRAYRLVGSDG